MKRILLIILAFIALMILLGVRVDAAVAVDATTTTTGAFTESTLPHTIAGSNRLLGVAVSIVPDDGQSVVSVEYGGEALTKQNACQISSAARQEVWTLTAPDTGTNDVVVVVSPSADVIIGIISFTGVDQTEPIYFDTTGVGANVLEIPMQVSTLNGSALVGFGVAVGDAKAATVTGQTQLWDVLAAGSAFRSEGILSPMTYTAQVTVRNTLNKVSDWAVGVLGIKASE